MAADLAKSLRYFIANKFLWEKKKKRRKSQKGRFPAFPASSLALSWQNAIYRFYVSIGLSIYFSLTHKIKTHLCTIRKIPFALQYNKMHCTPVACA